MLNIFISIVSYGHSPVKAYLIDIFRINIISIHFKLNYHLETEI